MAIFQGTSALALDGKGRVTVPVRHRELLMATAQGRLTLTKHPEGCLMVFPRGVWEQFRERLMSLPMAAEGWRRIFLGSAVDVEIDAASRVLVPPELRTAAALTRDLLLIGNGQRLELWDAQRHAEHEARVIAEGLPEPLRNFVL